ncbi:hypothetical protein BRC65_09645 [Halobacteriales archaeon QH_2_65_14]|nr:MAG: hypothetical protein BRC65_09645 [Halobacteriales archaeon QH_2_65_14]
MTLSEKDRKRLADVVELQPTKNAELQERWGMDSGSEVHSYLESELGDYYYRDENSLICATPEAERLVGEGDDTGTRTLPGTELERAIVEVLPGPEEESQSVVSTLHDAVRSALHTLSDKGIVEQIRKTVPTFRLALDRGKVEIETRNS